MSEQAGISFSLFGTAIGRCAIAWSDRGIVMVLLPEHDDAALRARILRRQPKAREVAVAAVPPGEAARAIAGITALVAGERCDLSDIALDLTGIPEFNRRIYVVARTVRPGATLTYGEIAAKLGEPDARRIGTAMSQNPCPLIVPCHRVVATSGRTGGFSIGGFSAPGGTATKRRLLAIEGAGSEEPTLFDHCGGLDFAVRQRAARRRRGRDRLS